MRRSAACLLVFACAKAPVGLIAPTSAELAEAAAWADVNWGSDRGRPPVSFDYGGTPFQGWTSSYAVEKLDAQREQRTRTFTDPATGLALTAVAVVWRDHPVVEWTLFFANTGASETPILSAVEALDTTFTGGPLRILHHQIGSIGTSEDYRIIDQPIPRGSAVSLASVGGRGSDGDWPYFNLEGGSQSVIVAIGWPGQWSARVEVADDGTTRIVAGQELTHFKLLPGERVRTPSITLLFHDGDWIRSQNLWRHFMIDHVIPRPGGDLPRAYLAGLSDLWTAVMEGATVENQKEFMSRYVEEKTGVSLWWMDEGWSPGGIEVGTWRVDRTRFPDGLRPISDFAHANGMATILWFEPERVSPGTEIEVAHPEWVLGPRGGDRLLNFGDPAARQFIVDRIDGILIDERIDIYRSDFNIPPLEYWRANDAPDRQGITEIKHVEGYLAMWDELHRRHPGLLIDSCAGGGRRNDLETLRRSVPLHKSDNDFTDIEAFQTQAHGLALWEPYFGATTMPSERVDPYGIRSALAHMSSLHYDARRTDLDFALLRKLEAERRRVVPYLWGDFYPLTPWKYDKDSWMAREFNRPEMGDGLVQVFRRPYSPDASGTFRMRGLEPHAAYVFTDLDDGSEKCFLGEGLMTRGLDAALPKPASAKAWIYRIRPRC